MTEDRSEDLHYLESHLYWFSDRETRWSPMEEYNCVNDLPAQQHGHHANCHISADYRGTIKLVSWRRERLREDDVYYPGLTEPVREQSWLYTFKTVAERR